MNLMRQIYVGMVALGCVILLVPQKGEAKVGARVESIEGAKSALLQKGVELREAGVGEVIQPGEHIRTDAQTKVIVVYADGSHLTVQPNTDLEIQGISADQVQGNQLHSGTVVGAVKKKVEAPGASQPSKIKFMIRTKVAVMGVRGTEFVAAFDAAKSVSQFNTLEGLVDVASNPTSLLSGGGTPVGPSQFVQATEAGVGQLQSFNRTEFLEGLKGGVGSSGSALGSSTSSPLFTAVSAVGQSSGPSSSTTHSSAPTSVPPAPRLPEASKPPQSPEQLKEKLAAVEREKPKMHPLAFSLGVFFANSKRLNINDGFKAVSIAWTPSFPLPFANFLVLRGHVGGSLFQNGSLNNKFLIREIQGFLSFQLLNPLFVEAGWGRQVWATEDVSGHIFSANAGLILSQNGVWNRLFVGVSRFTADSESAQLRAGVGIQF